jgi:hypothetical protein
MQSTQPASALTDEQISQMASYVEELLTRQIGRLKQYDLDGAMRLAQETQPFTDKLSQGRELNRPGLEAQRDRVQGLYKELCLVIASQRQEVADKLGQIRTGLKTLGTYAGK